jgi:uncharacterized membrane protein (DUF4010 family)
MDGATNQDAWIGIATSIACGMLIGIERERRKTQRETGGIAGLRTFASTALLGTTVQILGIPGLILGGALLLILLIAISYSRSDPSDPGVTTEVALFLTYIIGIVAHKKPALAGAITVCLTILLVARSRLHRFATQTLTTEEIRDGLILACAVTVILPILSTIPANALGTIDPRKLWLVVVLLLAIQTATHVSLRVLGRRYGFSLSGFAAGFISSTGTFVAMAARAKQEPNLASLCANACLLSQVASSLQLIWLVILIDPKMLFSVGTAVGFSCTALLLVVYFRNRKIGTVALDQSSLLTQDRAMFNPAHTLMFAVLLSALTISLNWVGVHLGEQAQILGAVIAGLVDLHASTAAILAVAAVDPTADSTREQLLVTILSIFSANAGVKVILACAGKSVFFKQVASAMALAIAACWLPIYIGFN